MSIGQKIRALRNSKDITSKELAKASGVQQATISRIENGKMAGTTESHTRLAEALGVTVAELYSNINILERDTTFQKAGGAATTLLLSQKGKANVLTKNVLRKKMMPCLVEIAKNGNTSFQESSPETEKFLFCIEGRIDVGVGESCYVLEVGDSLYFNASLKHQAKNSSEQTAKCLVVSSPPNL